MRLVAAYRDQPRGAVVDLQRQAPPSLLMIFGIAADDLHRSDEALQPFQRAGVLAERLGLNLPAAVTPRWRCPRARRCR